MSSTETKSYNSFLDKPIFESDSFNLWFRNLCGALKSPVDLLQAEALVDYAYKLDLENNPAGQKERFRILLEMLSHIREKKAHLRKYAPKERINSIENRIATVVARNELRGTDQLSNIMYGVNHDVDTPAGEHDRDLVFFQALFDFFDPVRHPYNIPKEPANPWKKNPEVHVEMIFFQAHQHLMGQLQRTLTLFEKFQHLSDDVSNGAEEYVVRSLHLAENTQFLFEHDNVTEKQVLLLEKLAKESLAAICVKPAWVFARSGKVYPKSTAATAILLRAKLDAEAEIESIPVRL